MMETLALSIGIGLVVSLLFSELFGTAPGGMVVPGYIALYLSSPLSVLITLAAALITYLLVWLLSSFVIIYGRRRTVIMILVGYLVGMGLQILFPSSFGIFEQGFNVVGYIIPGLIAIWLDRQGVVETFATLTTVSILVRLILILVVGEELAML